MLISAEPHAQESIELQYSPVPYNYAFPNIHIYKVRLSVMTRTIHPTPATSVNYPSAKLSLSHVSYLLVPTQ